LVEFHQRITAVVKLFKTSLPVKKSGEHPRKSL
jgi:hypothetical protein